MGFRRAQRKGKPRSFDYAGTGLTKQGLRDSTDINKILAKAQQGKSISHLQKHGAFYGDFAAFDLAEALDTVSRGHQIFNDLPSEIRRECDQDPQKFFEIVNSTDNSEQRRRIMVELAKPGSQFPVVNASVRSGQANAPVPTPEPEPAANEPPPSPEAPPSASPDPSPGTGPGN